MALCVMAVVSGHACCGGVGEAEYLLLTAQESTEWFCPLCIQSNLSISNLSLLDMNTSSMLLQPQIDEVTTTLTDTKHPGVSKTGFQHAHNENRAKNWSAKDKNYYERHKVRILANRKQQYQENVEVERAASRLRAKVNYKQNPHAKKEAARVNCKQNPEAKKEAARVNYKQNPEAKKEAARVNYKQNPEAKKEAARVNCKQNPEAKKEAARVSYAKNPKIKIGHSKAYYAKNKKSICAKARNKYSLCEPKLDKIETYLQEMEANLLNNSKARLALIKVLKE